MLEQFHAQGDHEHVEPGLLQVAEIEVLAQLGLAEVPVHGRQPEVVIDIEIDPVEEVEPKAGLESPSDVTGVELFREGLGGLEGATRRVRQEDLGADDVIGRGARMGAETEQVQVDEVASDQKGELQVHGIQGDLHLGLRGHILALIVESAAGEGDIEEVGGVEIEQLRLDVHLAPIEAGKDPGGEVLGEVGLDVASEIGELGGLVA